MTHNQAQEKCHIAKRQTFRNNPPNYPPQLKIEANKKQHYTKT